MQPLQANYKISDDLQKPPNHLQSHLLTCSHIHNRSCQGEKPPQRMLRSSSSITFDYSAIKSAKNIGDRAFSIAAPSEYNRLPLDVRNSSSPEISKSVLKTHLFTKAFQVHKV